MAHTFFVSLVGYYHWAVGWWVMITAIALLLGLIVTIGKFGMPNEINLVASWRAIWTIIFSAAAFFGCIGISWGLLVAVPIAIGTWVLGR